MGIHPLHDVLTRGISAPVRLGAPSQTAPTTFASLPDGTLLAAVGVAGLILGVLLATLLGILYRRARSEGVADVPEDVSLSAVAIALSSPALAVSSLQAPSDGSSPTLVAASPGAHAAASPSHPVPAEPTAQQTSDPDGAGAPVFDPPLPPELQFRGVELPIGRRAPRHQADPRPPDAVPQASSREPDTAATVVSADPTVSGRRAAAPRPATSRFAPDLTRFTPDPSVYSVARPPTPGTEGQVPSPIGTQVTTISVATSRRTPKSATPPPPIERLLPGAGEPFRRALPPGPPPAVSAPVGPPPVTKSAGSMEDDLVPEQMPIRARSARAPMPPLNVGQSRSLSPVDRSPSRSYLEDTTISPVRIAALRSAYSLSQQSDVDSMDSLLGEIGGVPRVEVLPSRPVPVADPSTTPAHRARESYEARSRELERAAQERLERERQRLEIGIREQLAYGKRELEAVLENRIEDTIVRPVRLDLPTRPGDDAAARPAID